MYDDKLIFKKRIFWANNRPSSSEDESEKIVLRNEVKDLQSRVLQLESKMRRLEFNRYHNSSAESAPPSIMINVMFAGPEEYHQNFKLRNKMGKNDICGRYQFVEIVNDRPAYKVRL